MDFKIGDNVLVIDEDLSGTITGVKGNMVTIVTNDGLPLEFKTAEIVKGNPSQDFKRNLFTHYKLDKVISEKEKPSRKKTIRTKAKERYQPTMEVDLHIHQLVSSTKGMTNHDILTLQLDTARRKLEFAIQKRIQKVVFIHGVGEGVLKIELDYLFGRYNNIKFYDANFQKYGLGATEVYIYQNVPS